MCISLVNYQNVWNVWLFHCRSSYSFIHYYIFHTQLTKFTFTPPPIIDIQYTWFLLQVISKICTVFADDWWNRQWFCGGSIKTKHNTLFPKWVIFFNDWSCKYIKIKNQQNSWIIIEIWTYLRKIWKIWDFGQLHIAVEI